MAKVIMIQGTMSNAGKSLLAAGLCRIFKQDGYNVAPFKSQNMALNSYVTKEGLEMGRAQVMQAEAAGIEPMVCMNPILLKPVSPVGSQVLVNGRVIGNMDAKSYFSYKKRLVPDIKSAFKKLNKYADIIVIEGAGSPAEINLKQNDIVNMGLAQMVDAPVILVGDIDRGGVFAQLLGTLMLLTDKERERVKGLVINKFRGDKTLLEPGIEILKKKGKVPVIGVVPYMELEFEDEDSLTERFNKKGERLIDIAVIRYPRISNFTDFNVFERIPYVSVRYVTSVKELHRPDLIFLPGTKNTISDLKWMRQNGLEDAVKKLAGSTPVFGICGGYQMLGMSISDPDGVEAGGSISGMELLKTVTVLGGEKKLCQNRGIINDIGGIFKNISGQAFQGYEIHMGQSFIIYEEGTLNYEEKSAPDRYKVFGDKIIITGNVPNIYGTYVHGLFDKGDIAASMIRALAGKKDFNGIDDKDMMRDDYQTFKEIQYDKLADTLREYLDMEKIYGILREAVV